MVFTLNVFKSKKICTIDLQDFMVSQPNNYHPQTKDCADG